MIREPRVSVLLPTYNRARFLPAAFESIQQQTLADWELVIVDDGSTDETVRLVEDLKPSLAGRLTYAKQANAGAYAARNAALDLARAPIVAFYDSDDLWLPHHLLQGVAALETAPEVDWVYAACRMVDYESRRILEPDTFRVDGRPRPFLSLRTRTMGRLQLIDDDEAVIVAIRHGLYCGLQNSVIRATVFASQRFHTAYRNEAEDQLFVTRTIKRGHRIGYIDDIHVQYHVHAENSSGSTTDRTVERQLAVYRPMARGFEDLQGECAWTPRERVALARKIGADHFWRIGYALLWAQGRRKEALESFRRGLRFWPWSLASWKTYCLAWVRYWVARRRERNVTP